MRIVVAGIVGVLLPFLVAAGGDAPPAAAAAPAGTPEAPFEWIKSLVGDWEGTLEWSGARTGKGDLRALYRLTGNGSAVVEDLIMGEVPSMTSVYHLDGADLRMTHYCAAGNQPRLKATGIDPKEHALHFDLVDVTNLKSPTAGHVTRVDLKVVDPNHLNLTFTFEGSGREAYEAIQVTRRPAH
ncbi:MAG TPA: hypothetical protein VMQ62_06935 [Dongiaceae bacterium]|nr:hypothetical protein [Dongiaceae bacterium]